MACPPEGRCFLQDVGKRCHSASHSSSKRRSMDGAPGDRVAQTQTIRQTFAWRIVALRKPDLAGSVPDYSYSLKIASSNYPFFFGHRLYSLSISTAGLPIASQTNRRIADRSSELSSGVEYRPSQRTLSRRLNETCATISPLAQTSSVFLEEAVFVGLDTVVIRLYNFRSDGTEGNNDAAPPTAAALPAWGNDHDMPNLGHFGRPRVGTEVAH